jgi:hypothetical protein
MNEERQGAPVKRPNAVRRSVDRIMSTVELFRLVQEMDREARDALGVTLGAPSGPHEHRPDRERLRGLVVRVRDRTPLRVTRTP